ncbi:MAG: leucine-rich repeat protein [Bacteroides sp.]|nr:leucine-rich repeat protein [Roseburia sp.]MCM1346960.1 leucine-rich repeat protein [Bacteroides sp.]MCM1422163.1 leucine-rich repeat protein [Bacteroides sp.]
MTKKIIATLLCLMWFVVMHSQVVGGIKYKAISDNEFEVVANESSEHTVVIPDTISMGGRVYTVVRIGDRAFYDCKALQSVRIPQTVEKIGESAFAYCTNLNEVLLGEGLAEIGDMAFASCSSLRAFHFPESLKSIHARAFLNCKELRAVDIPENVSVIEESTFSGCIGLTDVRLSNNVSRIGNEAFSGCKSIKNVLMPDNKPLIGNHVFSGCVNVENVSGHLLVVPEYVVKDKLFPYARVFCEKLPEITTSFSYYAGRKMIAAIDEWMKKKDSETKAQWEARINDEKELKAETEAVTEKLKQEYIKDNAPDLFMPTLDAYVVEEAGYRVKTKNLGDILVKVPESEADAFQKKWDKIVITPQYGIIGDQFGISECTFVLGKKVYKGTGEVKDDGSQNIAGNQYLASMLKRLDMTDNVPIDRDVDEKIPQNSTNNNDTFAFIIGNENYQEAVNVQFASDDAKIFAEYCKKTLGLPDSNVKCYIDASYATILRVVSDMKQIAKVRDGNINVIFYYAGHGFPDDAEKQAYLLPVDAKSSQLDVCYSLDRLYNEMQQIDAKLVTVFLDACFSGSLRGNGMIAEERGVVIKPKKNEPKGKLVVFSAATGDQTAHPYKEKGHGLFTYFLLKKLQESRGNETLGGLIEYIRKNVEDVSLVKLNKIQTPTVQASREIEDTWKLIKMR